MIGEEITRIEDW